jgi:hypothetical protein
MNTIGFPLHPHGQARVNVEHIEAVVEKTGYTEIHTKSGNTLKAKMSKALIMRQIAEAKPSGIPTDDQYRQWFRDSKDAAWIAVDGSGEVYYYETEPKPQPD